MTDPTGPETGSRRVFRGGGWSDWFSFIFNDGAGDARFCRSAYRDSDLYVYGWGYDVGFRVVLAAGQP